jgi:cytoskeleton protein RodZ
MVEIDENTVILGPGAQLKDQRERLKISIEDISKKLRLDKVIIERIEEDDYQDTLPRAYLKGYLRNYAKEVNLSEAEILGAFNGLIEAKEDIQLNAVGNEKRRLIVDKRAGASSKMLLSVVVVIVVGAALWFGWQTWNKDTKAAGKETSIELSERRAETTEINNGQIPLSFEVEKKTEFVEEASSSSNVGDLNDDDSINQDSVNNAAPVAALSDLSAEENAESVKKQLINVKKQAIILVYSGQSWVDIKDADGERIIFGLKEAGHISRASGVPPFDISLGDASVVTMSVAGKNVDLSQYPEQTKIQFIFPKR